MKRVIQIIIIAFLFFTIISDFTLVHGQNRPTPNDQIGCNIDPSECESGRVTPDSICVFERQFQGNNECEICRCAEDEGEEPSETTQNFLSSFTGLLEDIDLVCPEQRTNIIVTVAYSTAIGAIISVIILKAMLRNGYVAFEDAFLNKDTIELRQKLAEENPRDIIVILFIGLFWGFAQLVLSLFGIPSLDVIISGTVADVCTSTERGEINLGTNQPVSTELIANTVSCLQNPNLEPLGNTTNVVPEALNNFTATWGTNSQQALNQVASNLAAEPVTISELEGAIREAANNAASNSGLIEISSVTVNAQTNGEISSIVANFDTNNTNSLGITGIELNCQ